MIESGVFVADYFEHLQTNPFTRLIRVDVTHTSGLVTLCGHLSNGKTIRHTFEHQHEFFLGLSDHIEANLLQFCSKAQEKLVDFITSQGGDAQCQN